jgi:hypothetical protein
MVRWHVEGMKQKESYFISRKQIAAKYNLHPDTLKAMLESEADYKGSVVEWHYTQHKRLLSPAAVRWIEAKFEGAFSLVVLPNATCQRCGNMMVEKG